MTKRPDSTGSRSADQRAADQLGNAGDAIISVRNLQVEYKTTLGTVNALNGVSFDVKRGSVLGVVGESGSGKSVTARAIMQILERAGKITDGSIVFRRPPGDRRESTQHEAELEAALDRSGEVDITRLTPTIDAMRAIR